MMSISLFSERAGIDHRVFGNAGAVYRNAADRNTSTCASRLGPIGREYPPPMVMTSVAFRQIFSENRQSLKNL